MRLYDASEGEIMYNGRNIKDYRLSAYRSLFSTAFQDFQLFSMTVAENVLMREPEGEADYQVVREALEMCDLYEKVVSLPKGMDTVLTREFAQDGAILSGGESQKIAVARAFARINTSGAAIAIFDEPSSALDPIAEYRIYDGIMKSCKGKTVVFISHRLSTAVLADTIYLFEHGKIVESGKHETLMAAGGKYADMFEKQAQSYREEVSVGRLEGDADGKSESK
jgi:ATP-binding cassette subfamily B protein